MKFLLPYWVLLASRKSLFGLPCLFIVLTQRGLTEFDIGVCLAALSLAILAFEVPSGVASDRLGRRLTLVIAGLFRTAGWMLLSIAERPEIAATGFAFLGASFAFDSGTDSAWLYDTLKDKSKVELYSECEAKSHSLGLLSLGCASLVGGWLLLVSMDLALLCTVVPMVVSVAAAFLLEEPSIKSESSDLHFWHHVKIGLGVVWREKFLLQVVMFCSFAIGVLEVYGRFIQQFLTQDLGISPEALGYVYALWLALSALSAKLVPSLLKATRVVVVVRWAIVLLGLSLIWLGGSRAATAIALTAMPQVCFGILPILVRTEINKSIESEARATILSAFGFLCSGCMLIMAPLTGLLADTVGKSVAIVCLGVAILSVASMGHVFFESRRWRERPGWMASLWG
jgi:MFS family permease